MSYLRRVDSNQDLVWCVKIGYIWVFGSIVGSDYLQHMPPRNSSNSEKAVDALHSMLYRSVPVCRSLLSKCLPPKRWRERDIAYWLYIVMLTGPRDCPLSLVESRGICTTVNKKTKKSRGKTSLYFFLGGGRARVFSLSKRMRMSLFWHWNCCKTDSPSAFTWELYMFRAWLTQRLFTAVGPCSVVTRYVRSALFRSIV